MREVLVLLCDFYGVDVNLVFKRVEGMKFDEKFDFVSFYLIKVFGFSTGDYSLGGSYLKINRVSGSIVVRNYLELTKEQLEEVEKKEKEEIVIEEFKVEEKTKEVKEEEVKNEEGT